MKSQSQAMMIALAIVFAVALALTVAMICNSSMQGREQETPEPFSFPISPEPSTSSPPPTAIVTVQPEPETTADPGNGLLFQPSGRGTCTLVGLGACREAFVVIPEYSPSGDLVTAIANQALMGCETVTAIQIPSSVTQIGYLAFANCPNLIYISVSEKNTAYCDRDGVLYTSDGRTLLLYPPLHAGSSLYIPASVTNIADMAFYQCVYLTSIRYAGSAGQWENISIGSKNYSLIAASIIFAVSA